MSVIQVQNLSFTYPGDYTPVFTDLTFSMGTDWRLGLVGRNGRGKTTLMRLLSGELTGSGQIVSSVKFDMFPIVVEEDRSALACMRSAVAPFDLWEEQMSALLADGTDEALVRWGEIEQEYAALDGYIIDEQICREAERMNIDHHELLRPMRSFSPGERTRLLLAALFIRKNRFLLIDEPTNHLDAAGREVVARYLRNKQGFIVVSHDRWFLDQTIDHVMALQKSGVHIEQGTYSSYRENKELRDQFEIEENERLEKDIWRLKETAREKAAWSDRVEATKIGQGLTDRGRIGHLAAKMMKRSLAIQTRIDRQIEEKEALLHDLEYASALTLHPMEHPAKVLMRFQNVSAGYDGKAVFRHKSFEIEQGDRLMIAGPNGAGKSTMIRLMLGQMEPMEGCLVCASNLVISYMPQRADELHGTVFELAEREGLKKEYFMMILRKLGFPRSMFERDMSGFSMGQRKKVLLAASISKPAHMYIWDEPLNYIDLESREQIENMLADSQATMIFVEHDHAFAANIAQKTVRLP
ncbi:MAG: ABC-F type ribosomal protection protein [Clostridia bacterium]|nr:ABC-F type ribosomal protection protein [Clostridia bacterium]